MFLVWIEVEKGCLLKARKFLGADGESEATSPRNMTSGVGISPGENHTSPYW